MAYMSYKPAIGSQNRSYSVDLEISSTRYILLTSFTCEIAKSDFGMTFSNCSTDVVMY